MVMSSFRIKAIAKSFPQKVVTNDDLTKIMETSDEWIKRRTGIAQRHIATTESNTSMCVDVAKQLVNQAGIDVNQIDYIIVATMSGDYQTPSTAASVQGSIGASHAVAFDIDAACSGFVYGSSVMNTLLAGKKDSIGIVIGGEKLSRLVNWHDRGTAVLFGDGAAGILVQNDGSDSQILGENLSTFGEAGMSLTAGHHAGQNPFGENHDQDDQFLQMDGHAVYNFATKRVPESIEQAVKAAGIELSDIKYFVMHQANERIVKRVAKKLSLSMNKFPVNIHNYGNTAAASEPILLAELAEQGRLHRGDYLALTGFGGGLTVGTIVIKY
ncbi:beta-ketoacyl-ACP synthase III [Fructilactobacillus sanfranciscensis]|uniref:beta-ketoacyl-ACP synthase III n=1 Tax=Fructilactobacillus sanfranciscensis TaxID=1625 RepID=UPI003B96BBD9